VPQDKAPIARYTPVVNTFFARPARPTLLSKLRGSMRQIHVCAWLVMMSCTAVACSGEKFTASDESSATSGDTAGKGYGPPSRNEAAASNEDDGGDDAGLSSGGKAASAGSSSGGSSPGTGAVGGTMFGGGTGTTDSGGAASNEECVTGSVKFRMVPSPDLPHEYLCDAGCGTGWLTITDAKGAAAFSLFAACGSTSCDSCSPLPCAAAACLPTPLTAEGNSLAWDGTHLTEGSCGMNMACQRPACVAPGRYKARACAAINAGNNDMAGGACTPKATQLCAEAEFDFPETSEVTLVLKKY
jgi:hypothetical protein